ncbi:MAG TPA: hypothetical protein VID76_02305 [Solirubrobacterales bacterium]
MPGAVASAALIVAGSLAVGQAVLTVCGRRQWSWLAGPVGLAVALVLSGIVAGLGGGGVEIAIALGVLIAGGAAISVRSLAGDARPVPWPALGAAVLAALVASIPFIASGHLGILGVGLVNDDMASHLLLADWIDERFRPEPVLVDQGYPLGPHALVAGVSTVLHASSINVFAGLTLAIPALTALVAFSALDGLRRWQRVLAAALVALPYLGAAYLAQEAFKEPIMALFVLAFALLLAKAKDWRDAVPLGVLAAGVTYVYSFPGLAWLGGVAAVWGVIELVRRRRAERNTGTADGSFRAPLIAAGVGVLTLVVLMAPELGRLADFVDFRALHPDRANDGGLGNLPGQLSPLEALGIWPTSEFRLSAAASSVPAVLFYAGGLFALVALALALPRWIRKHGAAIPAALLAAAVLYLLARGLGTVYTSAKALSIIAPLIALVTLGGLLPSDKRPLRVLGVLFGVAAAASSFLILRQAPVAPTDHADELAQIRPLVEGEKLLFLGRDNFVLYELRGSKPYTHVRNFYDPYFVKPNFELADVGSKFDFDSVTAATLAGFPYVLTTRARYASGPPLGYQVVKRTGSYELWEKRRSPLGRRPAETGPAPGRVGGCPGERPRAASSFAAPPIVADAAAWSRTTIESGESATTELRLTAGIWDLSLQYDATRPVTLVDDAERLDVTVPGNLDYRGSAPFWPAGTIEVAGGAPVRVTATVERPPLAGRLLGAHSVAHLGSLAATRAEPARSGCHGYADWFSR